MQPFCISWAEWTKLCLYVFSHWRICGPYSHFFAVALLYSSVGFGGGSSYLAILALVLSSFFVIRSTALLCNLAVVLGSSYWYWRAGLLQLKKFLPFIATSIPMAFLGASFRLEERIFFIILGISLIGSAIALAVQTIQLKTNYEPKKYPSYWGVF